MTKEEIKIQLRSYRAIKVECDHLKVMMEEMEKDLYSPKSPNLDGLPLGGSGPSNPTADAATKHADLIGLYQQKLAKLSVALAELERLIEGLEPRARTLIRLYYAQGKPWESICIIMNYSWRQVHRIHSAALEALSNDRAKENTTCD